MVFIFMLIQLFYQDETAAMDPPFDYSAIPKEYGPHYARGLQLENNDEFKAALDEFTKSIKESPTQRESYSHRARVRYCLNDYAGTISDCDKVLSLTKNNPLSTQQRFLLFSLRGRSLKELGKFKEAFPDLEKAVEYNFLPNPYLEVELGATYMKVGKFDLALKQLLSARKAIAQGAKSSNELDDLIKEAQLKLKAKKASR